MRIRAAAGARLTVGWSTEPPGPISLGCSTGRLFRQPLAPDAACTSGARACPVRRILVTGGAGFIGSHLVRRLLDEGNEVLVVDNFYSASRTNLADVLAHPQLEVVRHDVTFPLYVEVDEIYHLACPASPVFYQRDPVQTTKTSVVGSINMLGLAKRTKARILLASTSEVYGDPEVHPQDESYWGHVNPIGIRSCYDEGKRCAETLFFDYRRQHDMPIKVARIFNTYGPRMRPDDGRVVSNFIVSALSGRAVDHLRRRYADAVVLLRRRPGRRPDQVDGDAPRGDRSDQPGQPARVHHVRTGREDHLDGRRERRGRVPPVALRRSDEIDSRPSTGPERYSAGSRGSSSPPGWNGRSTTFVSTSPSTRSADQRRRLLDRQHSVDRVLLSR